jgi:hypothetical protein
MEPAAVSPTNVGRFVGEGRLHRSGTQPVEEALAGDDDKARSARRALPGFVSATTAGQGHSDEGGDHAGCHGVTEHVC